MSVVACLVELVRLKDWRDELGRIEKDPAHDATEMARALLRYGLQKKAAWAAAKLALARVPRPTHFAIRRGEHYFAYLDLALGPTACVWKGIGDAHPFPSEREAREIMKICPRDAVLVPLLVEVIAEERQPVAANDAAPAAVESEGGHLD